MQAHICSDSLNSGEYGGKVSMDLFFGSSSFFCGMPSCGMHYYKYYSIVKSKTLPSISLAGNGILSCE